MWWVGLGREEGGASIIKLAVWDGGGGGGISPFYAEIT